MPEDEVITTDSPPEITLDSVDTFDADNLTDDQKTFLEDNKAELSEEQATKFGITTDDSGDDGKGKKKDDDDEDIDLDALEPESRGKSKKTEKTKDKDDDSEDDDDIDPEDEKMVSKVLSKKMGHVSEALKELQELKDQNEVDAFIRLKPEYEKYRGAALKYMAHPAYANIPAKNIMAIVASGNLQKLGAQKEREAAAKVKETKGNGTQVRTPAAGKPDYKNMSKEDFAIAKQNILQGAR